MLNRINWRNSLASFPTSQRTFAFGVIARRRVASVFLKHSFQSFAMEFSIVTFLLLPLIVAFAPSQWDASQSHYKQQQQPIIRHNYYVKYATFAFND